MGIYDSLLKKEAKLSLIGLGYVGLPIALAFARKISVIGFDINAKRVELMKQGIDPSNELERMLLKTLPFNSQPNLMT